MSATATTPTPPPIPQSMIDLADRKRLFPNLQPEFVTAAMLEKARRQAANGDKDLPLATKYAHSSYWVRKADEVGIPKEDAETMPLNELQEAIKTEMLSHSRDQKALQRLEAPREIAPAPQPTVAPAGETPKAKEDGEDLLAGVDLNEVEDNLAIVLKRMAGEVTGLKKTVSAKDQEIERLKQNSAESEAEKSQRWFLSECAKFKALVGADGKLDDERCSDVADLIQQRVARKQQGKSLHEDLAKLCKRLFGDDSLVGGKEQEQPTSLARPTLRIGAEEITGPEAARQAAKEYLEDQSANAPESPRRRTKL